MVIHRMGGLFVSETAIVRFWTEFEYVPEYSSGGPVKKTQECINGDSKK